LGRVAAKTLFYTLISSTASVVIGISLVNTFRPGVGLEIPSSLAESQIANIEKIKGSAAAAKPLYQTIVELIPKNPIDSAARALDGEMIAVMMFALIFGIGLSRSLKKDVHHTIISVFEQLYEGSMEVVHIAMKMAPLAVFCLVFSAVFKFGTDLLLSLALYVFIVILGLAIQQFGVYSLLLKLFARRSPLEFFRKTLDKIFFELYNICDSKNYLVIRL
jgi:DAACS family dicarboxylate/amino acid:cation (Na+ or H+) symporter